jgi:hypothetical protein
MRVQKVLFLAALVALPAAPALALAHLASWWACLAGPALFVAAYAWGLGWRRLVEVRFRAWSAKQEEPKACSPGSSRP